MSAVISLDRAQQQLIDVRLDSLDRILIDSRVSRSERTEIVQAVEDQIFEMLDQRGEEVTRECVLQLLRSLDPPEAYCSEDARLDLLDRPVRGPRREAIAAAQTPNGQSQNVTSSKHSGLAITSFVLSMLSIPTSVLVPLGSLLALIGSVFGVVALPQIAASQGRLRGSWMAYVSYAMFIMHFFAVWGLVFYG
jgi:hypothetical protein